MAASLYRVRAGEGESARWAIRREGQFVEVMTPLGEFPAAVPSDLALGEPLSGVTEKDALAPAEPTKIVCVGRNYRAHAEELGNAIPTEPLIFLKPPSALNGPGQAIHLPEQSEEVHHEAELAMVVGRRGKHVPAERAHEIVAGYTCANDVTARDIQRREDKFSRAKGFDTFCPVGPTMALAAEFEPAEHHITCRVNGRDRQHAGLDDFIFPPAEIIEFVSHIMTLQPGDLVLTGTPSGVGPIEAGDTVDVAVDGIGTLRNPVVRHPDEEVL
jgi:2-keto-4-pentenoate hydratase/2-oxohepta-3-ene-1,7-dioic acid hydratase in catechol pathway